MNASDNSTTAPSLKHQINSCRLFVSIGRVHTYYRAVCDAQLSFDEATLALSTATAERETRTRGLPASAAKDSTSRNAWMDFKHSAHVVDTAAKKALTYLAQKPATTQRPFYFSPEKMTAALKENDLMTLRAIMAKQSFRNDPEDVSFLLQVIQSDQRLLQSEALRTLALRCETQAQSLFEQYKEAEKPLATWSKRGLACLKAKENGLMQPREIAPVEVLD